MSLAWSVLVTDAPAHVMCLCDTEHRCVRLRNCRKFRIGVRGSPIAQRCREGRTKCRLSLFTFFSFVLFFIFHYLYFSKFSHFSFFHCFSFFSFFIFLHFSSFFLIFHFSSFFIFLHSSFFFIFLHFSSFFFVFLHFPSFFFVREFTIALLLKPLSRHRMHDYG